MLTSARAWPTAVLDRHLLVFTPLARYSVPMRCVRTPLVTAALLTACGGGSDAPTTPARSCTPATALRRGPMLALADAQPNAAAGSAAFAIAGSFPRTVSGRASAFEQGTGPTYTVIDAFAVDAEGRPSAELFIFVLSRARAQTVQLVPVSLAQLRDPGFLPRGSFAVYAEQFDAAAGDYTRLLVGQSGTLTITEASGGGIGRLQLSLSMQGEWQDGSAASLGCGEIADATVSAPLLRISTATSSLTDTLTATLTGGRSETMSSSLLDAFQVTAPAQGRLSLVASSVAGDSTRQIWLSLNGIPGGADSITIPLGAPTLEEARAGRAGVSFGMLRVNSPAGDPPQPVGRQLWRSTGGYVTLTNIVQTGPKALCGWVSGRYVFDARGTELGSDTDLGTLRAEGAFESTFTVLAPSDTLVDTAMPTLGAHFVRGATPSAASGKGCGR